MVISKSKHNNDNGCKYCKVSCTSHKKCKRCQILLHKKSDIYKCKRCGRQHTQMSTKDNNYCVDCIKYKKYDNNKRLR